MTQIIVTLEDDSSIPLIKKAIGLLKGVAKVVVHNSPDGSLSAEEDLASIPANVRSLIGIASPISEEEIAKDDRLAYLLSK